MRDIFESRLWKIEHKLAGHIKISNRVLHGVDHWREVALLAGKIANDSGADVESAMVAGFLHDVGRTNEFYDPAHGRESARIAKPLIEQYYPHIDADKVCDAIARHADGMITDDPVEGSLWDADRLALRRIGLTIREDLLSTDAGKRILREQ